MTILAAHRPNTGDIPFTCDISAAQPQPLHILYRDGKPCDEVIATPTPNPLPEKLARKEATKARLTHEDDKAISHAAAIMSVYGRNGKPPESYIPPDGNWTSSVPNQHLTLACARGVYGATRTEWEPRTIINPIKARRSEQARTAEGFHVDAFQSARAIVDRWQFLPWKGMIYQGQIWIEEKTRDGRHRDSGHWEPVAAQPAIAAHELNTNTPENPVEPPTVNAWIAGAVTRTSGSGYQGRVSIRRITDDEINDIYETFIKDPITETGNLQVALYVFAQNHYGKCEHLLRHCETALEPDDILSEFIVDLLERFGKGEYHTHQRKFHIWIRKKWAYFYSEVTAKFTRERKMTVVVNDVDDYEDEEHNRKGGEWFRAEVDREAMQRADRGWNTPQEQVRRMLDDLDNPATFWGQLSEPEKKMIRSMAKGHSQDQAAIEAGFTLVKGRRAVRSLREKAKSDPAIKNSLSRFGPSQRQSEVIGKLQACADSEEYDNVICIQACAEEAFEPLLGVPEAAKLLCVHPKTVQAMARAGTIPCTRIGKYWRFRASVLDVWVREAIDSSHQSRRVA